MNITPNTCHPSLNQWWKNGLRTVCLNWPFKFNSKRLVNDNNAWVRRWQAKAGGGAGGEKLPRGPILASRAATLLLQRPEERPAGWAAEPESGTVWSPLELRSRCSAS